MDDRAPVHLDWLIQTKLHSPRARTDLILRPRLLALLREALSSRPLTLVSAPAGYGKTTLLASLPNASPDLLFAWLSLDEEDNDPSRFLAALIASLQKLHPRCGAAARVVLARLPNPGNEVRRIVGMLINDILESIPEPFALILDDLHLITEPGVYDSLGHMVERMPPQMHLAVGTRHDPPMSLARLRARGQLAEVRLDDLRFTLDEASAFLNGRIRLGLSLKDLEVFQNRTEGWAAGLRILAGSLSSITSSSSRNELIAQLAQTDRHIFDFLAEEVLNRQDPLTRSFLLQTSILPELTPTLCRAVTARADAPTLLEDIYRRSLFVVAVDEAARAFRYHALFAEFLRRRLEVETPELVPELHRRAAQAQVIAARRITHYLAAEAWEEASATIERAAADLLGQGLVDSLRGWILTIPSGFRQSRPRLLLILGECAWRKGELEAARSVLEEALQGFEADADEAGQGEALMHLANVASFQHDYQRQPELIRRALAHPLPPHGRVQLLIVRAWLSLYTGDSQQTETDVDEAIRITLESGDAAAFGVLALELRECFALLPQELKRLESYAHQVLSQFGDRLGFEQAGTRSFLGYLHLMRGRIDEAAREAQHAQDLNHRLGSFVHIDMWVDLVLAFTSLIRGDYAGLERLGRDCSSRYEQVEAARPWVPLVYYLIGRVQWMQGRLKEARESYARICAGAIPQELPEVVVARLLMHALLEIADQRYPVAEEILRQVAMIHRQMPHTLAFGDARLLLVHLYLVWNRPKEALDELAPIMADCESRSTPGLILREGATIIPALRLAVQRSVHVDYASRLLNLLGVPVASTPIRVPATGEILTPREIEVLSLITEGASNAAIAERLVIAEETVKTHVAHLLRKLNASSRTQAVARARQLQILATEAQG